MSDFSLASFESDVGNTILVLMGEGFMGGVEGK